MSVVLNFIVEEECTNTTLVFKETTGGTSSTAWGVGGNEPTSNASTATLTVTNPDGVVTILNLFTSSFPTTNTSLEFEIEPSDIGYSSETKIPDGTYTFVYKVITSGVPAGITQTKTVYIFGQMQCRVYSLYGKIPTEECTCNIDAMELAFKASRPYSRLST